MSLRMVALSIAHSSRHVGAVNSKLAMSEYEVSARATEACAVALRARGIQYAVIDAADLPVDRYDDFKTATVNALNPLLAVEIHCNSAENKAANYGEVIHQPDNPLSLRAGVAVSERLQDVLGHSRHQWPWRGAREWSKQKDGTTFFFLHRNRCPALIIEGAFISNDEQALWLRSEGGAETYGLMVGEGIADFFKQEGF